MMRETWGVYRSNDVQLDTIIAAVVAHSSLVMHVS